MSRVLFGSLQSTKEKSTCVHRACARSDAFSRRHMDTEDRTTPANAQQRATEDSRPFLWSMLISSSVKPVR